VGGTVVSTLNASPTIKNEQTQAWKSGKWAVHVLLADVRPFFKLLGKTSRAEVGGNYLAKLLNAAD